MHFTALFVLLSCTSVFAQSSSVVDAFIAKESPVAKAGLLANIGADGAKSSGAKVGYDFYGFSKQKASTVFQAGIVIASPSTSDPDYLFTWVRDSSLVFKVIIDQYVLI